MAATTPEITKKSNVISSAQRVLIERPFVRYAIIIAFIIAAVAVSALLSGHPSNLQEQGAYLHNG